MKIEKTFSIAPPKTDGLTPAQEKQLRQAAQMYEQHFANEMFKAMRSTVHHDDEFLKQNMAEKIFQEQLDQKYMENWTKKGGIGLQDLIVEQIKQKYFSRGGQMQAPQGPLPIPKNQPLPAEAPPIKIKPLPTTSQNQLQYWMESQDPSESALQVLSPWKGQVVSTQAMDDGWSQVKIDHGQGLSSAMTFKGHRINLAQGESVLPGQKLGQLSPERPVLAWKLEWT